MADKEEMICPNCGSKKFIFMDSTTCKCDYCNSEWKLEDILGIKKIEANSRIKIHLLDKLTEVIKDKTASGNLGELLAGPVVILLVILLMIPFIIALFKAVML